MKGLHSISQHVASPQGDFHRTNAMILLYFGTEEKAAAAAEELKEQQKKEEQEDMEPIFRKDSLKVSQAAFRSW